MPSFGIELCLRIGKIELFIGIVSAVRGRRKRMKREGGVLRDSPDAPEPRPASGEMFKGEGL